MKRLYRTGNKFVKVSNILSYHKGEIWEIWEMSLVKNGDSIKVVFVFQKNEQIEEVELNSAQLSALLHSKQV